MLKQRPLRSSGTTTRELKQKVSGLRRIKPTVSQRQAVSSFVTCFGPLLLLLVGGFQRWLAGFVQSDGLLIISLRRHV